jgi:hypothetical protein
VVGVKGSALSLADVDYVTVTVSGPGITPDIVETLPGDPLSGWSGIIDNIPAGNGRTFLAQAFDGDDVVLYAGSATDVTILDGETAQVIVYLSPVDPPDPFGNAVPRFDSLVLSDSVVAPGNDISIAASASDPDGDPLVYAWSATGGSFGDPASPSTTWTAPALKGVYTLTVSATDPESASATISFAITVQTLSGGGSAEVLIDINTWPEVQGLVPDPTRIDVGETTQLDLTTSDPDGDPLSFSWTADCTGTFDDPSAEDPTFTLDADNGDADCIVLVSITDGRGGSNSAHLSLQTGPGIPTTGDETGLDCTNGLDDDGDGWTDCEDLGCLFSVCRLATGPCDLPELCFQNSCPDDSFSGSETVCREAAGPCDRQETCSGSSPFCPSDQKKSSRTMCRSAAGPCDIVENCSGSSDDCPPDGFLDETVLCKASEGICDKDDYCTGIGPNCPDRKKAEGTLCRVSTKLCDRVEVCDGDSVDCPTDELRDSSEICRPAEGVCDVAEYCSGTEAGCPEDLLAGPTTICRASVGICDEVAESCTGVDPDCPPDVNDCEWDQYCYKNGCVDKQPNGASCAFGSQCASNYCADGVCCDAACLDGCEACNLSGFEGTCTNHERGSDPEDACGDYNCSGDGECLDAGYESDGNICTDHLDCKPDFFCRVVGLPDGSQYSTCSPGRTNGEFCNSSLECASGQCVEGVCCDTACDGDCESCALPGSMGACTTVGRGTDPKDACGNYNCDGQGTCFEAGYNVNVEDNFCELNSDCKSAYYCKKTRVDSSVWFHACQGDGALGASCYSDEQCVSGNCVDEHCCDDRCDGPCVACDLSGVEGTCTSRSHEEDPEQGCGEYNCDGEGACLTAGPASDSGSCQDHSDCKPGYICVEGGICPGDNCYATCVPNGARGEACDVNEDCSSGHCVDNVCCNETCGDICEACDIPGHAGTCTPYAGGTDPENECGAYTCTGSNQCYSAGSYNLGTSCYAYCDTKCKPEYHCRWTYNPSTDNITTSCVAKNPVGDSCSTDCQCDSGHCVDSVCCNSECSGTCRGCNTPNRRGLCTYYDDVDPDNECGFYTCNGNGSCHDSCMKAQVCDGGDRCKSGAWCNLSGDCVEDNDDGSTCVLSCQCKNRTCWTILGMPICYSF